MINNRKVRLIQVAKEFKVGLNTIMDFLLKKGINVEGSPNSPVSPEVYAVLEKEFGSNRTITGNERENIRERISLKQTTVTLDEDRKQDKEDKEVIIKSNVINVKDEIPQPKILGKIDLEPKKKSAPAAQPAPEPQPKAEAAAAPAAEPPAAPAAPAAEPVKTEPAAVEHKSTAQSVEEPVKSVSETVKAPEAPKAEPAKETPASEPAAQPAPEAPKRDDNIFRPNHTQLTGPQILGTMDVSNIVPGGRHKRKRLDKEKVDVNRANAKNNGQQNNRPDRGAQGKGQQQGGGANAASQPKPGEGRRNKNKHQKYQPKPIVRPEVSDEEVSKQIKDTLARLTSKGAKNKGAKYRKEKREEIREKMSEEMEREQ